MSSAFFAGPGPFVLFFCVLIFWILQLKLLLLHVPEDQVYMDWEEGRKEYVLNETGRVYVGSKKKIVGRPWNFGQVNTFFCGSFCMFPS